MRHSNVKIYPLILFGIMFAVQMLTFYATRLFLKPEYLHDAATLLDLKIPFRPGWVIIYFLSYVSWIVNPLIILYDHKSLAYQFSVSYIVSLIFSAILFLLYPCTLERPSLEGQGLIMDMMRFLYAADPPTNLCPSLHVLITYFCFRGSQECHHLPTWVPYVNFVFLILVTLSILFVKQHVLIDIPAAILIAEFSLQLVKRTPLHEIPSRLEQAFTKNHKGGSRS